MTDSQLNSSDQVLVSELLEDDPEMRDIVEEFVDELPDRLQSLQAAFEATDLEQLAVLAHQLKGAGGSYGYPQLTELCAPMESQFRGGSSEHFATWMKQLEAIVAAAKAGLK